MNPSTATEALVGEFSIPERLRELRLAEHQAVIDAERQAAKRMQEQARRERLKADVITAVVGTLVVAIIAALFYLAVSR